MNMKNDKTCKIAYCNAASRYSIDDKLAGYTTRGKRKDFRKAYKASVRHARRVMKSALTTEIGFV